MYEEIIFDNYKLFNKKGEPYTYKDIDLSVILLHKLAGYNGRLHTWVKFVHRAKNLLAKADIFNDFKSLLKICDLADILYLINRKNSNAILPSLFFAIIKIKIKCFEFILEKNYKDPAYVPLEVPLIPSCISKEDPYKNINKEPYIFLATMNNYLNPMIPMINEFIKEKENTVVILPKNSAQWNNFNKIDQNAQILFIEDLLTQGIYNDFQSKIKTIKDEWLCSQNSFYKNVKWQDVKFFELFKRCYEEVYINYIPHTTAYIDIAREIRKKLKPKGLFVARLRRSVENSFNEVFSKYDIPKYMLIHGHISDEDSRYFTDGYFSRVDKIFVWGEWQKQTLLNKNFEKPDKNKIIASGNPSWDSLIDRYKTDNFIDKEEIKNKLNIKKDYILIAAQSICSTTGYKKAVEAILTDGRYDCIIKVHPEEDISRYKDKIFSKVTIVKNLEDETDLHSLIRGSKLVLTHSSTAGTEALYCGTHCVILDFNEFRDCPLLIKNDDNYNYVKDARELQELLKKENFALQKIDLSQKSIDKIKTSVKNLESG